MMDARNQSPAAALAVLTSQGGSLAARLGLPEVAVRAAGVLAERGWIQGLRESSSGQVCLHGALELAAASGPHPGDGLLTALLFNERGCTTHWNDEMDRTREDVLRALTRHPITDEECAAVLGPQWAQVVVFLRTAAELPLHVYERLAAATPSVAELPPGSGSVGLSALLARARLLVGDARAGQARHASALSTHALISRARGRCPTFRVTAAALGAAGAALALRDLLDPAAYDEATLPWRAVVGPLHGDDAPPVVVLPPDGPDAVLNGRARALLDLAAMRHAPPPVARFLVRTGEH